MLKRFTSGKDVNNNKDNVPDSKKEAGAIRKALNKLLAVGKNKACVTGIAIAYLIVMATSCGKECKLTEKDGYTLDTKECKYTENPVVPPVVVEICEDYTNPDCPNYDPERVAREALEALKEEIKKLEGDSVTTLNDARAALEPALTDPYDIKVLTFSLMRVNPDVPRETFKDTADYIKNTGYPYVLSKCEELGWPTPNPETMPAYFGKCDEHFSVCDVLKQKRAELKAKRM